MSGTAFIMRHNSKLESLANSKKISEEQFRHLRERGAHTVSPSHDFGLDALGQVFPEIVIGASQDYIKQMIVPYQETSFLAARATGGDEGVYVFQIPGHAGGGVERLTGGKRNPADNIAAAISRICVGYKANIVSADNFMQNKGQIWNYHFFADHLMDSKEEINGVTLNDVYEDLEKLAKRTRIPEKPQHVVVARSEETFKRLNILGEYGRGSIAALDPRNETGVIFLTNQSGYEFARGGIRRSDFVHYVNTGAGDFDMYRAMKELRNPKSYGIDMMLNDGGRQMSNGVRQAGLLGGERVTLVPYPGADYIPENLHEKYPQAVLGREGAGIDGNEIEGSIEVYSQRLGSAIVKLCSYAMNESKIRPPRVVLNPY